MLMYLQMLDTPEEKEKFETLYYTYRFTMLHIAKKILKDHQLAEDAVQEAFIRIAKNFSKISGISSPQTRYFVVVIIRNVSLTMWSERQKLEPAQDDVEYMPSADHDVEECVFDHMEYEEVVSAIRKLPPIYKDVLFLQYVEEYKLTEISNLLGLEVETVKKRAQRGKKKLLDQLTRGDEGVHA